MKKQPPPRQKRSTHPSDIASEKVYIRATPKAKKQWQEAALRSGKTLSAWIAQSLDEAAARLRLPYSRADLAKALDRTPWYVSMMFRAGCPKEYGGRASLDAALAWLKRNPDFNAKHTERYVKAIYPNKATRKKAQKD